jgi:hypothetical protein
MNTKNITATLCLAALVSLLASAALAQQAADATVNMRVGMISVTTNNIVQMLPESGTFKLTTGANPPACNGGTINISHSVTMTPYSDVIIDRMLATLTAAQLSGRLINGWLRRDSSNRCFLYSINMSNQ